MLGGNWYGEPRLFRRYVRMPYVSILPFRSCMQMRRLIDVPDTRLNSRIPPFLTLPVFVMVALLLSCSSLLTREEFKGTVFRDERKAQDFALTDQFGVSRSLHGDYAGEVVVLTFLYTECPDVCPIVANHLRDVSAALEEEGTVAQIVVVSVDPEGDTVDSVLEYSNRWKMTERWTYLVGAEVELKEVWRAYYIDPYVHGPGRAVETPVVPSVDRPSGGVSALVEQSGRVIHSAPIYIIDGEGLMRSAFTLPLEWQDVVHDVKLVGG